MHGTRNHPTFSPVARRSSPAVSLAAASARSSKPVFCSGVVRSGMVCLMLVLLLAWPSVARAETWGQYLIEIADSGSMDGSDPDRLVMLASLALVASLGDADQVMVAGLNELAGPGAD